MQKGYTLNGKVIRPSMVKVVRLAFDNIYIRGGIIKWEK